MKLETSLLLLAAATGLAGGFTPCALGINTILVGALSGKERMLRIANWTLFALARAVMLTTLGLLFGLVGQLVGEIAAIYQQIINVGLIVLGTLFIVSRYRPLPLPSINLMNASWFDNRNSVIGLGLLFGLDISACISPLLAGLLAQTVLLGDWRVGALSLFIFGIALSVPALAITLIEGADRWLQKMGQRYSKAFYIVAGSLLILFGATEFWLTVAFT